MLSTPTGYPFIQVFYNATGSKGGATAMTCILIVSSVAGGMTNMAAASRQLFAFARDKGLPFHTWFARVDTRWEIPVNCELSTTVPWVKYLIRLVSQPSFSPSGFPSSSPSSTSAPLSPSIKFCRWGRPLCCPHISSPLSASCSAAFAINRSRAAPLTSVDWGFPSTWLPLHSSSWPSS